MIDVIFPVLNERQALPWVLGRLPSGFRAIVVDNGSTDGSAEVATQLGAAVVIERQRGFGAACWRGLQVAESDVVAFCDADASLDPTQLHLVTEPVCAGGADLALGCRRATTRRAWPLHARIANDVLARRVARHTGVRLTDLGPMRAARRVALIGLGITDRRFGWPLEMVLRGARAGWSITEVEVDYRPRVGQSKVTGTVRGTVRTVSDMRRVLANLRQ